MSWLSRLVPGGRSELGEPLVQRIREWKSQPEADLGCAHFEARYVVVNTEASGLDLNHDRLLALAAIVIDGGTLSPSQSVYLPLGTDPAQALVSLLEFTGKSPWVVFNSAFNRNVLEGACSEHLNLVPEPHWLDTQWLLPALFPEHQIGQDRLSRWMDALGIETFQRHHALGDAYAIAQIFMAALGRAQAEGLKTPRQLIELERSRRWNQRDI